MKPHEYAIIPISLDACPVPIRAVTELEKDLIQVQSLIDQLVESHNTFVAKGEDPTKDRGFFAAYKILMERKSKILEMYEKQTHDVQNTFETKAVDFMLDVAKNNEQVKKILGEKAAKYFQENGDLFTRS